MEVIYLTTHYLSIILIIEGGDMKLALCLAILKNFKTLLSPSFWRQLPNPDHPTLAFVKLILLGAIADIIRMICIPNYPQEPGVAE